jgi:hypothetical protein
MPIDRAAGQISMVEAQLAGTDIWGKKRTTFFPKKSSGTLAAPPAAPAKKEEKKKKKKDVSTDNRGDGALNLGGPGRKTVVARPRLFPGAYGAAKRSTILG